MPYGMPPPSFASLSSSGALKKARVIRSDGDMILKARDGFYFGADPEVFIFDKNGQAVAPDMIPGTKEEPYPVEGGALQRDGMAAEFNINKSHEFGEWNSNFEKVLDALQKQLPEGYTWKAIPSVEFSQEVFDNAPDDYKLLGCSPDWNAWERDLNPPPHCADRPFLRTASGHIHVGWGTDYSLDDPLHQQNCFDFVKQLDWMLALWSLKMDPDVTRRQLYGKAGACRLKPYGVEYRVLSNFWITSRDRRLTVWNRVQTAIKNMQDYFLPDRASGFNDKLVAAINTGEMDADFKKKVRYPMTTISTDYAQF